MLDKPALTYNRLNLDQIGRGFFIYDEVVLLPGDRSFPWSPGGGGGGGGGAGGGGGNDDTTIHLPLFLRRIYPYFGKLVILVFKLAIL
jgi:hypothetical protein